MPSQGRGQAQEPGPGRNPIQTPNSPVRPGQPRGGGYQAPAQSSGARLITPPRVIITQPPGGGEIRRSPGGSVREVRTPTGAVIHYAPDGMRRVEAPRPDGRLFVATPGGRGGYIQRPFRAGGQVFVQRTYVQRGVAEARVYRSYDYRGVTYQVYQPARYYRPTYYTWSCRPWRQPVYYAWGWRSQPWFTYYRGWCSPYPYYVSPIFWLTDFMLAITLEEAYQARLDSAAAAAPPPPEGGLTPEVKQAIADEVQRQLQQEQAQQQVVAQGGLPMPAGPPPLFADNVSRIFLVYTGVPVFLDGYEHYLSEGDVLQLRGAPSPGSTYADVTVLASRNRRVPKGSVVSVNLQDLQEMQNHMQATIDQGLGELQNQQGRNGLPQAPPQSLGVANASYLGSVQADPDAARELAQVARDANQAGQGVLSQGVPEGPGRLITQGMTVEEVHQVLGDPRETASVGPRLIEVYSNFKVTYLEGRVTEVQ